MSVLPTRSGAVLAAALLLSAGGCGSDAEEAAAPPQSASPTPGVTATPSSAPAASGLIAYRRYLDDDEEVGAIFVSAPDGTGERQVTHPSEGARDDEPEWSPDGTHLLFTRITPKGEDDESARLYTVTADGDDLTPVSPERPSKDGAITGGNGMGAYSRDGSRIAAGFYGGHVAEAGQHGVVDGDQIEFSGIDVMDADGTHLRHLTDFPPYSGDADGVAWSPDGRRLVFARANGDSTEPDGALALVVMDADGAHQRQLTKWPLGAGGIPDWTAAGDLIVFRAVKDEESGIGNFFTIHPDGTDLTQVTHFTDKVISHKVAFSPDGRRIVFGLADDDGKNEVFTAALDGSDLRQVTHSSTAASSPDWGPAAS